MNIQGSFGDRGESSQNGQELEFITFNNPESARTSANQQLVRRHAMRDYHRRTDRPRLRKNEIELDITPLLERSAGMYFEPGGPSSFSENTGLIGLNEIEQQTTEEIELEPYCFNTVLGASHIDPLLQYQEEIGEHERELYAPMFDDCIIFRQMRDFGFLNRIRECPAFRQFISASSWNMSHLQHGEQNTNYLQYSVIATAELQKQINDPHTCTTIESIAAILGFACCANMVGDMNSVQVHMDGLSHILGRRGGLDMLDLDPLLRIMLFWVDLNSCCSMDISPRFPIPTNHINSYKHRFSLPSLPTRSRLNTSISSIFENPTISQSVQTLRDVQTTMQAEASRRDIFNDTIFPGIYLSPICHDILSMRSHLEGNDAALALQEAFRLACIIHISELRALFGFPAVAQSKYASKLQNLLYYSAIDWLVPDPFLLWVLAVVITAHKIRPEQRKWFITTFRIVLGTQEVESFEDLIFRLSKILWNEGLLRSHSQTLRLIMAQDIVEQV